MRTSVRAGTWAWLIALALGGCGGGGSGGAPGPSAATPGMDTGTSSSGTSGGSGGAAGTTSPTLKFSAANSGKVAGYPLWASEGLMRLGNALTDDVVMALGPTKAADSGACDGGTGSWSRTLQDNDGNGEVSAGDLITLQFNGCHREPLARMVDGVVRLKITAVDSAGGFVATVTIASPGVGVSATVGNKTPDFRVSGTMRLALSISDTRRTMTVGDGVSDEVLFDFPWMSTGGDRVSAFRLQKSQHWDEARSYLNLQMRYDSPELGGSFDVSMPTSITSWLDSLPDPRPGQGWLLMRGAANDQVRIDVIGTGGAAKEIGVKVDFAGDGTVDLSGAALWTDAGLVSGYFFADYTPGGLGNTYGYDPNEFSLRAPFRATSTVGPNDVLRIQFTRPPVDAANWHWHLVDRGGLPGGIVVGQEVPATVQTLGALVLIKPLAPLPYSHKYDLTLDAGTPVVQGQLLRATTGGTLNLAQGLVGSFSTLDYLNPQPSFFQQPLYLGVRGTRVGTLAQSAGAPPATYLWTQVAGPPVVFSTPTAAETNIALGGGAVGIDSATLRLTMTLPDGTSASADMVVRAVHDTALPWSSVVHVPAINGSLPERFYWGAPAVGQLQIAGTADRLTITYADRAGPKDLYPDWSLQIGSGDGAPLKLGQYTNAWSPAAPGRPAGSNLLAFDSRQIGFAPWGSDFNILELETDSSGVVTKLAVDFTARGVGDYSPITGSVRWNSTLAPAF